MAWSFWCSKRGPPLLSFIGQEDFDRMLRLSDNTLNQVFQEGNWANSILICFLNCRWLIILQSFGNLIRIWQQSRVESLLHPLTSSSLVPYPLPYPSFFEHKFRITELLALLWLCCWNYSTDYMLSEPHFVLIFRMLLGQDMHDKQYSSKFDLSFLTPWLSKFWFHRST